MKMTDARQMRMEQANMKVKNRYTDDEWNRLMWATSHMEVDRILKEVYARRCAEGYPKEGFDRLSEVENLKK